MVANFVDSTLQSFDIRNFLDSLTPTKEKNKYICPVCEGHNLSIEPNTGEYQCWNGCKCQEIREKIKPWSEVQEERKREQKDNRSPYSKPKPNKSSSTPIPTGNISIGRLPTPTASEQSRRGESLITKYEYSPTQWVERTDNPDGSKKFSPCYINCDGAVVHKKGDQQWLPYQLDEIIQYGAGQWVLDVEGEKCADTARISYQLLTFTFLGSASETEILQGFKLIKDAGVIGVLRWADNDDTGHKKAEKCSELAAKVGLHYIIINHLKIFPECPAKGDIVDFSGVNNMNGEELAKLLQEQIKQAATKNQGLTINPISQDLDEKLKLDLLALLQESDPIKKFRKRSEICSHFRLHKNEVEELLKYINRRTTQQEIKSYSIDDLFDLETEGLTWLIPELLPRGETIILAGSPKAGKSLLAIDTAFAIATGESHFLGEKTNTGKVLLVSCDESINSTKSKLIKRGFRRGDNIEIMPQWTIDQLDELEAKIEAYRPDLVIVDSLKRITHGSQISENSAEFADNIYTLKELFAKYSASGILIHHSNKNNEATGVHKLRGSSAIAGAVWGTWQIDHILKPDPNNKKRLVIDPKDPVRVLSVFARDTEGQTLNIQFNPEDNSWERLNGEEDTAELSYRERILNTLTKNSHCEGLSGRQVQELLGEIGNRAVYTELNRMANKKLISCKPGNTDKRINIYSLPNSHQPKNMSGDSPPPPGSDRIDDYSSKTIDIQGLDNSHQVSHQIVINSHQQSEKTDVMTIENPCTTSISMDSHQWNENKGGEGVPKTSVHVVNATENETNTNSNVEAIAPPPIKPGDEIRCYPTEDNYERKKTVIAEVVAISYDSGGTTLNHILICDVKYLVREKRKGEWVDVSKPATICGALAPKWINP